MLYCVDLRSEEELVDTDGLERHIMKRTACIEQGLVVSSGAHTLVYKPSSWARCCLASLAQLKVLEPPLQ